MSRVPQFALRTFATCKLNSVEPLAYLTDILIRIVNGHPSSQIEDVMTAYVVDHELKAVA